ncbi:MAG: ABC transporter permease [Deltaproteobacteria bacterium]|jgi:ABC-2 type transport system permease protein|nr:ABC transporter permease [Deltaproteobacteria bacterium]
MRILRALIVKEFIQVKRDPATVFVTLLLPLVLMFIFGYGVNLDVGRFPIGLVVESDEPESVSLLTAFSNSKSFDVVSGRDIREFEADLIAGRLKGLAVVPADFGRKRAVGQASAIQIVTDGTEANTAALVRSYIQTTIAQWEAGQLLEQGRRPNSPISLEPRAWFNPELTSRNFLLPGAIAVILTITGVILTALVIAREWERGTMESLMSAPASVGQIIFAKLFVYFSLALFSLTLCWAVAVHWYEIPFRGSFLALLALGSVFLVAALGQGLLISALTKNQYHAAELAMITGFLPSFLLSGVIFEISSMPLALQTVTRVIPARYFVSSLQTLFLAGNVWPLFVSSMLHMALIGLAFFFVMAFRTVKKVA